MSKIIAATFETRRDAEMAVEHLVQEHGIDRGAVTVAPVSAENSAGTESAGGDREGGRAERAGTDGEPALAGRIKVSAEIEPGLADKVESAFSTYGGKAA